MVQIKEEDGLAVGPTAYHFAKAGGAYRILLGASLFGIVTLKHTYVHIAVEVPEDRSIDFNLSESGVCTAISGSKAVHVTCTLGTKTISFHCIHPKGKSSSCQMAEKTETAAARHEHQPSIIERHCTKSSATYEVRERGEEIGAERLAEPSEPSLSFISGFGRPPARRLD
jgi:hypothetical protein